MNNPSLPKIIIVIPCFNEEAVLPESLTTINGILDQLKNDLSIAIDSHILCVDDGSKDNTWQTIINFNKENPCIKGLSLTHNRGHQFALLAGLMESMDNCDAAISIDADLQDDPNTIIEMVERFKQGNDIVYGVRKSRATDSWFKRNSARLFYHIQSSMGLETIYDHADYRLMSNHALQILSEYKETNLFLRGIIPLIGLNTAIVYYDRKERASGESKYPLKKMLEFSIDGITSFSSKPMRWILMLGIILLLINIIVAIYVLMAYFGGNTVSGWTSLILSLWFLCSLILVGIGILGEYIGKIYMETKGRPRYNINKKI